MIDDEQLNGLTVHILEATQALRTTSEYASAVSLKRGDVIVLTEADIEASKDRNGVCSWACADDPEIQQLRYGKQIFGVGPWPTGLPLYANAWEDPASWNSGKAIIESSVNAEYAGTDGSRGARGVQPRLRGTW